MEQLFDYEVNVNNCLSVWWDDKSKNDTDDYNVNINKTELKVGDSFNNWDEIQVAVDSFAKKNSLWP